MNQRHVAAVIGASGIGKHHCKWLAKMGFEVAAIVGTTPDSLQATTAMLRKDFGISPVGYLDVVEMMTHASPSVVHVCSPPEYHYEHFMAAAARGCHILCEKPLTWDDSLSIEQLILQAKEMAEFGGPYVHAINTQYTAAAQAYRDFCEHSGILLSAPEKFFMQMDSRNANKTHDRIWVDLATHPLSILIALCGEGEILPDSDNTVITCNEVVSRFTYKAHNGSTCEAEIVVRAGCPGQLIRRFGINDFIVDYSGHNDDAGVFRTYLSNGEYELASDDFMYTSIRHFVDAVRGEVQSPLSTVSDGFQNLTMQYELLKRACKK